MEGGNLAQANRFDSRGFAISSPLNSSTIKISAHL
jgi:hypothetical protein